MQLLISTHGGAIYKARLKSLLPLIQKKFPALGWIAVQAIPYMDSGFNKVLGSAVSRFAAAIMTM